MVFNSSDKGLRDLYNRDNRYSILLDGFKRKSLPIPENQAVILDFLKACEDGTTMKRRSSEIGKLRLMKYLAWLPRISEWYGKPFSVIDEAAFKSFMERLNSDKICSRQNEPYSYNTKLDLKKITLK